MIIAGAWVLYTWFATDWDRKRPKLATADKGVCIARVLYALAMIAMGLSLFFYLKMTLPLVSACRGRFSAPIPPVLSPFWLVPQSLSERLPVALRSSRPCRRVCLGLFTLLVWVGIMAAGHNSASQWGEFVVSWTLAASGWVVVDSWPAQRGHMESSTTAPA